MELTPAQREAALQALEWQFDGMLYADYSNPYAVEDVAVDPEDMARVALDRILEAINNADSC
jgi:hypothetical protein